MDPGKGQLSAKTYVQLKKSNSAEVVGGLIHDRPVNANSLHPMEFETCIYYVVTVLTYSLFHYGAERLSVKLHHFMKS